MHVFAHIYSLAPTPVQLSENADTPENEKKQTPNQEILERDTHTHARVYTDTH